MFLKSGRRLVILSSAVAAFSAVGASAYGAEATPEPQGLIAGSPRFLEGDYAYTTVGYCVESATQAPGVAGFDPQTLQLLTPGQIIDLVGSGTLHFKANGTLTLTGSAAWVLPAQTAAGSNPVLTNLQQSSTVGSYVLGADGAISVVQTFRQDVNSNVFVIVQPTQWQGVVVGKSVNLSIQQNVETLQTFVNGVVAQENQVICVQTLNASKLSE